MTGGRAPREKGTKFERELVRLALRSGLKAERMWGSNGQAKGYLEGVDVVIGEWTLQAKRYARIAAYLKRPEGTDGVIVREDHGEALVVLPYSAFLNLIGGVNEQKDSAKEQGTLPEIPRNETPPGELAPGDGGPDGSVQTLV